METELWEQLLIDADRLLCTGHNLRRNSKMLNLEKLTAKHIFIFITMASCKASSQTCFDNPSQIPQLVSNFWIAFYGNS